MSDHHDFDNALMNQALAPFLLIILVTLVAAGVFMVRGGRGDAAQRKASGRRMAWALALRVALSVGLFLLVLLAWHQGWIQPKGLPIATGH